MALLNFPDIQGFVLSSYATKMPCANYFLLKITDAKAARAGLTSLLPNITTGTDRKTDFSLNIAFTATGLTAFGVENDELISFLPAFQEGMVSATRQQLLGDTGNSEPKNWDWGYAEKSVDILLLLFAIDEIMLKKQADMLKAQFSAGAGIVLLDILSAGRQPDSKEHFGFLDGIGQPTIEGTGQKERQQNRTGHATELKAGEFVLGYENEMNKTDPLPANQGHARIRKKRNLPGVSAN